MVFHLHPNHQRLVAHRKACQNQFSSGVDTAHTRLWKEASTAIQGTLSPTFLQREWEQVILAQNLTGRDAYLTCERKGRGRRITTAQRAQAWTAIAGVVESLRGLGQQTHLQIADEAARILAQRDRAPHRHVLVDEGQDLHPAQWRLLRQAVADGPDDLFIVSDPHQRIYDNRVSLASLGIEVRDEVIGSPSATAQPMRSCTGLSACWSAKQRMDWTTHRTRSRATDRRCTASVR